MDTGGKIATGVIVPLAVGGAAVAAYFLLRGPKKNTDDSWNTPAQFEGTIRTGRRARFAGGKRRTHRRRR